LAVYQHPFGLCQTLIPRLHGSAPPAKISAQELLILCHRLSLRLRGEGEGEGEELCRL
jgi:hypothetical protein